MARRRYLCTWQYSFMHHAQRKIHTFGLFVFGVVYVNTYVQLSPALRNRFVEIWCPSTSGDKDLSRIIQHNLKPSLHSSICLSVCLSALNYLSVCVSVCTQVSVCLCVCLHSSICLSVCLSACPVHLCITSY